MHTDPAPSKQQSYCQSPPQVTVGRKSKKIYLTVPLSAVWRQATLEMKPEVHQRSVLHTHSNTVIQNSIVLRDMRLCWFPVVLYNNYN